MYYLKTLKFCHFCFSHFQLLAYTKLPNVPNGMVFIYISVKIRHLESGVEFWGWVLGADVVGKIYECILSN